MPKKYSPEFREQLVREVIDHSRSVAEVARENNVAPETMRQWVMKARKAQGPGADTARRPQSGLSERDELERLRKENRELRMERDFLKKAAAFFAKDQR